MPRCDCGASAPALVAALAAPAAPAARWRDGGASAALRRAALHAGATSPPAPLAGAGPGAATGGALAPTAPTRRRRQHDTPTRSNGKLRKCGGEGPGQSTKPPNPLFN